jgi:hypothetical protein
VGRLLGSGTTPITLTIRHFHFSGEIQRVGLLTALGARIAQSPLPSSVLDTIWVEVDAQFRLGVPTQQLRLEPPLQITSTG